MADNTTLNLGAGGDVISTDDLGSVKVQRVKVQYGTDGSATDVSDTNPLPIDDAGGSITVDGTVELGATTLAALESITVVDGGSTISIDDGAGSITVDGTVELGATSLAALESLTTISTVTTVSAVTSITNALPAGTNNIGDVDVLSVVPGTSATSLGKAEDAAHASGDTGVMSLAVRRDADTTLVSADGDYAPLQVNAAGSLKVAITSGAGSGGTSIADGASFTRDTTSLTPVGGVVESSAPTLTAGDAVALSLTTGGAVRVAVASGGVAGVIEDAASAGGEEGVMMLAVRRDAASSGVSADGDFAALSVDSNGALRVTGGGGGTQYAEDAAHTTGDTGTLALVVRQDTATQLAGTNGDYTALITDSSGRLHVNVGALPASTNTIEVVGDAATDAAVSGNPVYIAGRGNNSTPTAMSAANDVTPLWLTLNGAVVVSGETLDDSAFTPGTNRVVAAGFLADETSTDSVDENDIGAPRMTLDRKVIVTDYAHAAGGATPGRILSAASTNGTVVKASAGTLYSLIVTNTNAAVRYLKIYNSTSVTVGTTTPTWTIAIPGATTGAGFAVPIPACGINFSTGICMGLTTGAADNDTGAVASTEICVNYSYV